MEKNESSAPHESLVNHYVVVRVHLSPRSATVWFDPALGHMFSLGNIYLVTVICKFGVQNRLTSRAIVRCSILVAILARIEEAVLP